jgi:hypothetical protein
MADSQTLARAIIEVGAQGVTEARPRSRRSREVAQGPRAAYSQGKVKLGEYAAESGVAAIQDRRAQGRARRGRGRDQEVRQRAGRAAAMAKQAEAGAKGYGQGVMAASFAVQDFMSANGDLVQALYRVQNNIPMILTMFGMGSGLAGVISMGSLAFGMLLPHLMEAAKGLGLFKAAAEEATGAIDALQLRIKELESKPTKLAVDLRDLDQAKKQLKELEAAKRAFEAAGEGRTPEEREAGERAHKAFGDSGAEGRHARDEIKGQMVQELTAQSPTIANVEKQQRAGDAEVAQARKRAEVSRDQGSAMAVIRAEQNRDKRVAAAQAAAAKERVRIEQQAETEAGKLFEGTFKGNDKDAREELVRRLNAAGRPQMAANMGAATPEQAGVDADRKVNADAQREAVEKERAEGKAKRDRVEAEAERVAGAMNRGVGQKLLEQGGDMSQGDLFARVKKDLDRAGIESKKVAELVPEVAKKLRENLDKAVQARMFERGIGEGQARAQLLKEEQARDRADRIKEGGKTEIVSTDEYLKRLFVAGFTKGDKDDVPAKQLAEQQAGNKKLDKIADVIAKSQKGNHPATFAGGRSRS